ncbi:HAD-IB family phosphatase [Synechococcus sp. MIT S9452]|uniref:HAD-IB family phosphatase n=1 Tax=Synechococcus sp. MIT S9452 TaxID=3082546 RepID=UPI0039A54582
MDRPAATVFCDFDGTVTSVDTFDAVAARAAPELWADLKAQLFNFEITLLQGMQALADALTPHDLQAMVDHMGEYAPRPCFLPFLAELERAGVPFVLVSGGLVPLVEEVLGAHRHRLDQLIAAEVLPHPDGGLRFESPFANGQELVAKAEVVKRYGCGRSVVIGDSITDLGMAEVADLVFAREPLSSWLEQRGIAFHSWDSFADVEAVLRQQGLLPGAAA